MKKLSEWMGERWDGELPFDEEGGKNVATFGAGCREATRLRVFCALSVMGAGNMIGVYSMEGPYGRKGLSLSEAFVHAEMRGTVGGFLAATENEEHGWFTRAAADEINQSMKDAGFQKVDDK